MAETGVSGSPEEAPAFWGSVKFYDTRKGFGFLTSESIEGDVKFGAADIPADLKYQSEVPDAIKGFPLAFNVVQDDKGMKATRCSFVVTQEAPASLPTLWGVVKQYNPAKAFGFIKSPYVETDVIFGVADLPEALHGRNVRDFEVAFDAIQSDKGTRATNMAFVLPMGNGSAGAGKGAYNHAAGAGGGMMVGGKAGATQHPPQSAGQMTGYIASFNPTKGFGFITVDQLQVDAYFKQEHLLGMPPGGEVPTGTRVQCDVVYYGEKPQAQNIIPAGGQGAGPRIVAAPNGNGAAMHAQDAFGPKVVVAPPKRTAGQQLVILPPAKRLAPAGYGGAAANIGGTCTGTIASYNELKGWGFISCPAIGADAYFQRRDLVGVTPEGCWPGASMTFDLEYANSGQPQAKRVRLEGESGCGMVAAKGAAVVVPAKGKGGFGAPSTGKGVDLGAAAIFLGERLPGRVKYFQPGGFGFITTPDIDADIWFGVISLLDSTSAPAPGSEVTFVLGQKADGRLMAENNSVECV